MKLSHALVAAAAVVPVLTPLEVNIGPIDFETGVAEAQRRGGGSSYRSSSTYRSSSSNAAPRSTTTRIGDQTYSGIRTSTYAPSRYNYGGANYRTNDNTLLWIALIYVASSNNASASSAETLSDEEKKLMQTIVQNNTLTDAVQAGLISQQRVDNGFGAALTQAKNEILSTNGLTETDFTVLDPRYAAEALRRAEEILVVSAVFAPDEATAVARGVDQALYPFVTAARTQVGALDQTYANAMTLLDSARAEQEAAPYRARYALTEPSTELGVNDLRYQWIKTCRIEAGFSADAAHSVDLATIRAVRTCVDQKDTANFWGNTGKFGGALILGLTGLWAGRRIVLNLRNGNGLSLSNPDW